MLAITDGDHRQKPYVGLKTLSLPVKSHLQVLDEFMQDQVETFEEELQELVSYCLKNSGKRIRPILVFYSGWRMDDTISELLVKASAVIEFVHLATLVHDDVLDRAILRHNDSTVSKKFGSDVAVLLGDALFSQALKLASDFPVVDICRAISKSTRRVCAGEIKQTFQRGNTAITLQDYYRIIDCKTGELFYVSCYLGAKLGDYDTDYVKAVANFGRHLGVAYQILDDLMDFLGEERGMGKTLGTDIAGGKFTLPLILLLRKLNGTERETLLRHLHGGKSLNLQKLNLLMAEKEVFVQVADYFNREIETAEQFLSPFADYPSAGYLQNISGYIKVQMQKYT